MGLVAWNKRDHDNDDDDEIHRLKCGRKHCMCTALYKKRRRMSAVTAAKCKHGAIKPGHH